MADKEERIVMLNIGTYYCPLMDWPGKCFINKKECSDESKCNIGLTRSEAVEIMADAIVKKNKEMGSGAVPIFLAQAALDALLGWKK